GAPDPVGAAAGAEHYLLPCGRIRLRGFARHAVYRRVRPASLGEAEGRMVRQRPDDGPGDEERGTSYGADRSQPADDVVRTNGGRLPPGGPDQWSASPGRLVGAEVVPVAVQLHVLDLPRPR